MFLNVDIKIGPVKTGPIFQSTTIGFTVLFKNVLLLYTFKVFFALISYIYISPAFDFLFLSLSLLYLTQNNFIIVITKKKP